MKLEFYFSHVHDIVFSRRSLSVELFRMDPFPAQHMAVIEARLRYWDGSMLRVSEKLIEEGIQLRKVEYVYHYQQQDGTLIFRYDNVPHYPNLPTHPHHKHIGTGTAELVEAVLPPQLIDVLREVEQFLAGRG